MQVQVKIATIFLFLFSSTACQADGGVQARARATRDKPKPAPSVLIYSDQSPGALEEAIAQQGVAKAMGRPAALATDLGDFVRQLSAQRWSWVVVTARYTAQPPYAGALRAYAQEHPRSHIELVLWHDNGTKPTSDTAVTASRSDFMWNRGRTTISYTGIRNTESEVRKPRTVPGLLLPDFEGIEVMEPEITLRLPAQQIQEMSRSELIAAVEGALRGDSDNDCLKKCLKRYIDKLVLCKQERQEDEADCDFLYGPMLPDDEGDPDAYDKCTDQVSDDYKACKKTAIHRHDRCKKICTAEAGLEIDE